MKAISSMIRKIARAITGMVLRKKHRLSTEEFLKTNLASEMEPLLLDPALFLIVMAEYVCSKGCPPEKSLKAASGILQASMRAVKPESVPGDMDSWLGDVARNASDLSKKRAVEMMEKVLGRGLQAGPFNEISSEDAEKLKRLFGEVGVDE